MVFNLTNTGYSWVLNNLPTPPLIHFSKKYKRNLFSLKPFFVIKKTNMFASMSLLYSPWTMIGIFRNQSRHTESGAIHFFTRETLAVSTHFSTNLANRGGTSCSFTTKHLRFLFLVFFLILLYQRVCI